MNLFDKIRLARKLNKVFDQFQKGVPMSRIFQHPKTTLVGMGIAALLAVQAYNGKDWKGAVIAAVVAALGAFAKDN